MLVQYGLGSGHLRFYLAPKVISLFLFKKMLEFGLCSNLLNRSVTRTKMITIKEIMMRCDLRQLRCFPRLEDTIWFSLY